MVHQKHPEWVRWGQLHQLGCKVMQGWRALRGGVSPHTDREPGPPSMPGQGVESKNEEALISLVKVEEKDENQHESGKRNKIPPVIFLHSHCTVALPWM